MYPFSCNSKHSNLPYNFDIRVTGVPLILSVYQIKKNTVFKKFALGNIVFTEEFVHYDFMFWSFQSNNLVDNLTYNVIFSMKCDLELSNFALCRRFLGKMPFVGLCATVFNCLQALIEILFRFWVHTYRNIERSVKSTVFLKECH
jgi:hypothetical protein